MLTMCLQCSKRYDDAMCWTICPHDAFITDQQVTAKDLATSLLLEPVTFNHQPDGPVYRITAIDRDGMVTLDNLAGLFAPHLFKKKSKRMQKIE
jgi:hypothetical protein